MPTTIDVIILSYAKTEELKNLTLQTIDSLLNSEDKQQVDFNIVVLESNKQLSPYQFKNTTTIYPTEEFGFNKYLNIGIKQTNSSLICLCNNDLLFHKGWAIAIIEAMQNNPSILSASTVCPIMHNKNNIDLSNPIIEGYEKFFSGWCFMIKRSLIDKIGYFDGRFKFWYADTDYLQTLKKHHIKNYLITGSLVTHLNEVTSKSLSKKEHFKLTLLPQMYFNYKWGKDSYLKYQLKLIYFKLRFLLGSS